MKILCLSEVMPYSKVAHAGGKVFYNHILRMATHAEVHLLCYCDKGEEVYKDELTEICKHVEIVDRGSIKEDAIRNLIFQIKKLSIALVHNYISLGYPVNVNLYKTKLKQILTDNKYDIIEMSFTSSLAYLPFIKSIDPKVKVNIIEHDVSYLNLERSYKIKTGSIAKLSALLRYKVYKKAEISMLRKCNMITVLNNKDRRLLVNEGFLDENIYTESPYFQRPSVNIEEVKVEKIKNSILFYGAMWRKENDESIYNFLMKAFPKILEKKPDVKLFIVGNKPTDRIKSFHDNKNIIVTGFVEDPTEYFLQSEVCVVPLVLGAGIKIKTLEALAYGLPLIATTIGIEGIDADNEEAAIRVDNIEDFSEEVVKLLDNDRLKEKLRVNSLKFINRNYDLDLAVSGLVAKYKEII